jgi:hypothetical protein
VKIKEKVSDKRIQEMAEEYVTLWLNKEMQEYVDYPKKHPEIKDYLPYIKRNLKVLEENLEFYEKNNHEVWDIKKIHELIIDIFKSTFKKNLPYLVKKNTNLKKI